MDENRSMAMCCKCNCVTRWLSNHIKNKHVPHKGAQDKLSDQEKAANRRVQQKLDKESKAMTKRLTDHIAVSEDNVRGFFHDKGLSVRSVIELMGRLGRMVVPRGREHSATSDQGHYNIPEDLPERAYRVPQPVQPPEEQEEAEQHDDEEDVEDDEEYIEGDSSGDEDEEQIVNHGPKYGDGTTRRTLQDCDIYARFNRKHPSNEVLQLWYEYETTIATVPPKREQDKAAHFNQKTTQQNHASAFLFFAATKGHSNTEDIPKLCHTVMRDNKPQVVINEKFILYETQPYVVPFFKKLRDNRSGAENLKTRGAAINAFYDWLGNVFLSSSKHQAQIDFIKGAVNKLTKDIRRSVVTKSSKLMRVTLNQEEIKTVNDVMRYLKHPKYLEQYEELRRLTNNAQFLNRLENMEGELSWGRNKDIRTQYNCLVGSIMALVCLKQCQRPSVLHNLKVQEIQHALAQPEERDKVVFVFKHKTTGPEGKKPASFTIKPDEEWLFRAYNDFFRPLVSDNSDQETVWLLNTSGMSMQNMIPEWLAKWQTGIYGESIPHATITEGRSAIQTLVRNDKDWEAVHHLSQQQLEKHVSKKLHHSEKVASLFYDKPTIDNVIKQADIVRQLMDQTTEVTLVPNEADNIEDAEIPAAQENQQHQPEPHPIPQANQAEPEPQQPVEAAVKPKRLGRYKGTLREKPHPEFDMQSYLRDHPLNWGSAEVQSSDIVKKYFREGHDKGPKQVRSMRDNIRRKCQRLFAKEVASQANTTQDNIRESCATHGTDYWADKIKSAPKTADSIMAWVSQYLETPELMAEEQMDGDEELQVSDAPEPTSQERQKRKKRLEHDESDDDQQPTSSKQKHKTPPKKKKRKSEAEELAAAFAAIKSPVKVSPAQVQTQMDHVDWPLVRLGNAGKYGEGVYVKENVLKGTLLCHYPGE